MFNSDNGIGGFHDDVLSAVPTDAESSLKLIEEIKNRAKGSISSHNYPGAITLYTKAIEVCPSDSLGAKAILYSNRSLCHFSMSNWDNAIDDADQSIIADPTYMKVIFDLTNECPILAYSRCFDKYALCKGLRIYPQMRKLLQVTSWTDRQVDNWENSLSTLCTRYYSSVLLVIWISFLLWGSSLQSNIRIQFMGRWSFNILRA